MPESLPESPPPPVAEPEPDLRGLLHDVGHGLFTLSLLVEAARGELLPAVGAEALELIEQETTRLLAVLHSGARRQHRPVEVELRALLQPFVALSERTVLARVVLQPGPPVRLAVDPAVVWRVVANLLDNAVRAAGPLGTVRLAVHRTDGAWLDGVSEAVAVDVVDDGPGFQLGPRGAANLGLTVVASLLDGCGGRLQIDDVVPHGTRMRVLLPVGGGPGIERSAPWPGRPEVPASRRSDEDGWD